MFFVVGELHIARQLVQPLFLLDEPYHLFEYPHRDVLALLPVPFAEST